MPPTPSPILPHALALPIFNQLRDKRVILASSSPRRKELLEISGLRPEVVPSTFKEDLPKSMFENALAEYPLATAAEKAMEVYERLVKQDEESPPDLVISADTVIIFPPQSNLHPGASAQAELLEGRTEMSTGEVSKVLEKPFDRADQYRVLQDMNGKSCEVVTGVTIVYPILSSPGFKAQSLAISTVVHFNENSDEVLQAYVKHGEGLDRAGGFAIQGTGGLLVKSIEGDYNNVVGFPTSAFWKWMGELGEDGVFED